MSDSMPCSMYDFLPQYYPIADKIRVLNHFLNDRDIEELELEDLAGAATLAKELDAQMRARFLQAAIDFARLTPEQKGVAADMYAELCGQIRAGEEKMY